MGILKIAGYFDRGRFSGPLHRRSQPVSQQKLLVTPARSPAEGQPRESGGPHGNHGASGRHETIELVPDFCTRSPSVMMFPIDYLIMLSSIYIRILSISSKVLTHRILAFCCNTKSLNPMLIWPHNRGLIIVPQQDWSRRPILPKLCLVIWIYQLEHRNICGPA